MTAEWWALYFVLGLTAGVLFYAAYIICKLHEEMNAIQRRRHIEDINRMAGRDVLEPSGEVR